MATIREKIVKTPTLKNGDYVKLKKDLSLTEVNYGTNSTTKSIQKIGVVGFIRNVGDKAYTVRFFKPVQLDMNVMKQEVEFVFPFDKPLDEVHNYNKHRLDEYTTFCMNHLMSRIPTIPECDYREKLLDGSASTKSGAFVQPIIEVDETRVMKYQLHEGNEVPSLLLDERESGSFYVYLPIEWVDMDCMDKSVLLDWMELLNNAGLGVTFSCERIDCFEEDKRYPGKDLVIQHLQHNVPLQHMDVPSYLLLQSNDCYVVRMEASELGSANLLALEYLLCIYKNRKFVGLVLQLQKANPTANPFELLLMGCIVDNGTLYPNYSGNRLMKLESFDKMLHRAISSSQHFSMCIPVVGIDRYTSISLREMITNKNFVNYYLTYKKYNDEN